MRNDTRPDHAFAPLQHARCALRVLALCACAASTSALAAGGLSLLEIGTRDLGLAGAGYAARAEDASTAFTNPAGMTRIIGNDVVLGTQLLYGDVKFSPNVNTSQSPPAVLGSDNGGNPIGWLPGGSAFYVHSVSDDVKLGFGLAGNFGLAEKFNDDWVGRYYIQQSTLVGLTLMPSAAWKANAKLSFGVGLNAMYGILKTQMAINNLAAAAPDGQLKIEDRTWGFGGTLGMLYELSPGTRLGATYTSRIRLDFKAQPQITGSGTLLENSLRATFGSQQLDLGMNVPQSVMTSMVHQLDSQWAILGNLGWQQWSRFGEVEVSVNSASPSSLTTQSKFKDTWHAAFGAQYRYSDPWLLSGGIAYDSSLVSDADRSIALPLGAAWSFGAGARYQVRKDFDVSFGYELKWAGDLQVDNNRGPLAGRVAGDYKNAALHFFGVTFHWNL